MTAPFVQAWLDQRGAELRYQVATFIREFPDRVRAVFHPDWNAFWDEAPRRFRFMKERVGKVVDDLPLLRACDKRRGGCGAHVGAPCTTAEGKVTSHHKPRRQP